MNAYQEAADALNALDATRTDPRTDIGVKIASMKAVSPTSLKTGEVYSFGSSLRRVVGVRPVKLSTPVGPVDVIEVVHTSLNDSHPMTVNYAIGAKVYK
jgi:hypothetical protein